MNFDEKVSLLADVHRTFYVEQVESGKTMAEFVRFHDLGLPLAYLSDEGFAVITETGIQFVEAAFLEFTSSEELTSEYSSDVDRRV